MESCFFGLSAPGLYNAALLAAYFINGRDMSALPPKGEMLLFDAAIAASAAAAETMAEAMSGTAAPAVGKEKEEETEGKMENDGQSSEHHNAGSDAVHDNGGGELPEEAPAESLLPPESGADADTAAEESSPPGSGAGEGSGAEEAESPGREEALPQHGGGSGSRAAQETEQEPLSGQERGRPLISLVREAASRFFIPEPETESAAGTETETGAGAEAGTGTWTETGAEAGTGTETETETETGAWSEAPALQEGLLQVHYDLQVLSCLAVVFLVIALCHYSYRFFKIFF